MSMRDTQFANFAKLLYEELAQNVLASGKPLSEVEAFKQEQHQIIARRAYDLVSHTVLNVSISDLDMLSYEECVERMPDLTEWPKDESLHE